MKNKLKTPLTLLLAFATCMTVAACTNESSSTDASSDNNTSSNEEATLAERSTSAITTAPAEDPTTNAIVTDAPITDTPVTNEPATIPETEAPAKDTTKTPETEAPVEDTTKAPETSAPEEETKAPETAKHILTIPPEDPSIDYSQWGKYGFEKILPEPLPYSDQEADWKNARFDFDPNTYCIISQNIMYSTDEERAACYDILNKYANSLKKYGYDLYRTNHYWELTDDLNNTILIALDYNAIVVDITFAKV